jgi:hypothetical protein
LDRRSHINLDPGVSLQVCGPAGSQQIPDTGWPYEGRGNTVAFSSPIEGNHLFPFYVFKIDGGTDSSYFSTGINPTGRYAAFIDDGFPPLTDEVTRFGTIRWYEDGANGCPAASIDGSEGGTSEEGGMDTSGSIGGDLSKQVSVWIKPSAIGNREWPDGLIAIEEASIASSELRGALSQLGAVAIGRAFPRFSREDLERRIAPGRFRKLADLSNFYHLEFQTIPDAVNAVQYLRRLPDVESPRVFRRAHSVTPASSAGICR